MLVVDDELLVLELLQEELQSINEEMVTVNAELRVGAAEDEPGLGRGRSRARHAGKLAHTGRDYFRTR